MTKDNKDKSGLKPCPFCGNDRVLLAYDYGIYAVCQGCGANGPHRLIQDEKTAVTLWNRRKQVK
jgi:Lar family restriction alleviation protein